MRHNIVKHIKTLSLFLLIMLLGGIKVWGQPDEGLYYIANYNNDAYNSETPANNYYLVPAGNPQQTYYIDAYYSSNYGSENGDSNQPFLTTYKTIKNENSVWRIEASGENGYYYIIHQLTGRYIIYEPVFTGGDSRRKSMHLKTIDTPDDKAKFAMTTSKSGYAIRPKSVDSGHCYFNVAGANSDNYYGTGSTMYFNGLVGLYSDAGDKNGVWIFEKATVDPPTFTNNYTSENTFTITAETGATIYYTTDGTTPTTSTTNTGTTSVNVSQNESMTVIKAIAKGASDHYASGVVTYEIPKCERPVITVSGGNVTISCAIEGATIYYTTNGDPATSSSTLYTAPFAKGSISTIRAIAIKTGYLNSSEAALLPPKEIASPDDIDDMSGNYILADNFSASDPIGTSDNPFKGIIDGNMITRTLSCPLVAYADGATIKNVILDNVSFSGTNVGAICNEAIGDTRIYNCGVLASNSNVAKDEDGYDKITSCSSRISGSGFVGGIVGLLDGSSRVINCFSYANVSGGSYVGGIVGYNNVATTATNLKTMVMNCMFYGEVSGSSIAPIYNGAIITNVGDNTGVGNFNYFRLESSYIKNTSITKVYNCALGAETRFLQRFEFYRHLLNSNRELAAWWATGDVANKEEMMKWVMEPTQIGTSTPYPILKTPDKYASVVNYTPDDTPYDEENRNKGRKLGTLAVTIQNGTGGAGGASISTPSLSLTITDKDYEHFNFNYGKVQLPYYNEVGTNNYTDGKVVTGWKIVSITGGTAGSYSTGDDVTYTDGVLTATPYNFADRKCTKKDLYGTGGSNRVFNQGAYWDVPEGVTAITIQPYWGKAVYLADAYYDVVYSTDMKTAYPVTTVGGGQHYNNGVSKFNNQLVYTSMANAVTALNPKGTVYDNAVVLVGNYHEYSGNGATIRSGKPYTITSVDLDEDNEPDYSLIWRFDGRTKIHPVRYDFLNVIGLGMAQKSTGGTGSYNFGIPQPLNWFEVTNTALFRVTQFEYSPSGRSKQPIILQGGVIEQWVTQQQDAGDVVSYFHVGGNVWFKEFHRGSHQDNAGKSTPHPPVSVTGGDYSKFYLTGLYQSQAAIYDDNAECYISGGRFGEMAGAGMEGIGTSDGKGNITWVIDYADIKEFYGGGINAAKPVHGNIHTIIKNSYVDQFCGGPKFGDMVAGRTVTTTATDCTFGTYFGAGFGGNSYNRYAPKNRNNVINLPGTGKVDNVQKNLNSWNDWVGDEYKQSYNSTYNGVSTQIDYQFIPMSSNIENVARLWVEFVNFSLATCRNVTSTLTGCKITGNFYGGGSLGKVAGDVTSTLTNCNVTGSVYGAGYSASLPTVEVDSIGFRVEPYYYTDLGTYNTAVKGQTTTYTWQKKTGDSWVDNTNHILYTNEDLTTLGAVTGKATLTIEGTTTVGESVYGGGEESGVDGDTEVNMTSGTIGSEGQGGVEYGNVYGGGKGRRDKVSAGLVKGHTKVNISQAENQTTRVYHNVYGGGAYGSVGDFNYDNTTGLPTGLNGGAAENSGKTEVYITGGTFGWSGKENGMVFGSSRGDVGAPGSIEDKMAWVYSTHVAIGDTVEATTTTETPLIKGSVYGGGENGHVLRNAYVRINGGTIGIAEGTPVISGGVEYSGAAYPYRGNVYGAGCGTDMYYSDPSGVPDPYDGNGDTYNALAGIVQGNTIVNVSGGHVIRNVYGAGAMGSVGTVTKTVKHESLTNGFGLSWPFEFEYGTYTEDENVKKTGKTTVSITGGRIGVDGDGNGYVYGAARGAVEFGETDVEEQRYIEALYANVRETEVIINYPETPSADGLVTIEPGTYATIINDNETPCITGAVFGGGEDGHVYENAKVEIQKGFIGNSVYGGGRGKSTYRGILKDLSDDHEYETDVSSWIAGKVYGNVDIIMTGGHVVRNIYGGGNLGSVGKGNYSSGADDYFPSGYGETLEGNLWTTSATKENPDNAWHFLNSGKITVKVQGGTVGMENGIQDGLPVGGIFGSSRGKAAADVGDKYPRYEYAPDFYLGYANETEVEIGAEGEETGPTIWGSVYGGGRDGHVRRNTKVTVFSGTIGKECTSSSEPSGIQWTERGNVFGSGSGMGMYDSDGNETADKHGMSSGSVTGWTQVNIKGGTIYQNVYGGGALSSVGAPKLTTESDDEYRKGDTTEGHGIGKQTLCEVNIEGGTIGTLEGFKKSYGGSVFGAGRGGGLVSGEYAEDFATSVWSEVNVKPHATDPTKNPVIYGSVFGGGEQGLVKCGVDVNISGGEIKNDVYGGGAKAHTNTSNWTYDMVNHQWGSTWADADAKSTKYTTAVSLTGATVRGNAYGGGLGESTEDAPAYVYGDVELTLNKDVPDSDKGCVVRRIFGANNALGSPKGDVLVHVYKTQNAAATRITNTNEYTTAKVKNRYDVEAVYGGGNEAAYEPVTPFNGTAGSKTKVIVEGCERTSINTVYGGGNAAAVPETNIEILGAYEIFNVFGGGNGKDKKIDGSDNPGADVGTLDHGSTTYGTGNANTLMGGGLIHEAYGGSNQKGIIKGSINQITDPDCGECELEVEKIVGAGKYADIDGDVNLTLSCQPERKVDVLFAGADEANVNGNITLNITNGHFGKVFGGNNLGGAIKGKITVNVEETGCQPIKIDNLYLGSNEAAYSVFGYYESEDIHPVTGKKILKPRVSATDPHDPVENPTTDATHTFPYAQPELNIISCTYIGNVFGGGLGDGGKMYADPTVNINMEPGLYANDETKGVPYVMTELGLTASENPDNLGIIRNVYGGGEEANIEGNPTVNIATVTGKGAYIIGNVFGGGKGKNDTYECEKGMINGDEGTHITIGNGLVKGNVYGGGEIGRVEKDTEVTIGTGDGAASDGTSTPEIQGDVFGAGKGLNTHGYAALVRGNTTVTVQGNAKIGHSIYGGGEIASVGKYKVKKGPHDPADAPDDVEIGMPYSTHEGGICNVTVKGYAEVGPDNMQMKAAGGPDDTGYVFGAGKGILPYEKLGLDNIPKRMTFDDSGDYYEEYTAEWYAYNEHPDPNRGDDYVGNYLKYIETLALTTTTYVTIGGHAFIKGSVYGGSENGHVQADTHVKIQEHCQIGAGDGETARYDEDKFINPLTTQVTESNYLKECAHWDYKSPYKPYDKYDETTGGAQTATDGHTFYGNVFGGGSGLFPYTKPDESHAWLRSAGRVYGNTNVEIVGGHILTSVYGGCELTDVGNGVSIEEGKGRCFVKMSGGTLGVPRTLAQIAAHPVTCYLFGAGKGDQRTIFNQWTNVGRVFVEINDSISQPIIYGSVFGGGEDGHVLGNVSIKIKTMNGNDPIIGTWGTSYVDGNVFGGGRGFGGDALTAGVVCGNVNLNIAGGKMLGSIYGGGRLGSVGTYLVPPTHAKYGQLIPDGEKVTITDGDISTVSTGGGNHGHVAVNISGGTIGNSYEYIVPTNTDSWSASDWTNWKDTNHIPNTEFGTKDTDKNRLMHTKGGNVFAGAMGRLYALDGTTVLDNWADLGKAKKTEVTISGGTVKSNVYGGGELGAVINGTEVTVTGGAVGGEVGSGTDAVYTYGSVFGGGYGSDANVAGTYPTVEETSAVSVKDWAGRVKAGTQVEMKSGETSVGHVWASVYGGGELAWIDGETQVTVSAGEIGKNELKDDGYVKFGGYRMGNVFGGGKGSLDYVKAGLVTGNTEVTISGTTETTKIYHNIYGGGALGSVGSFTYDGDGMPISMADNNTGTATLKIIGGTIGINGHDNGMVNASSRGGEGNPSVTPNLDRVAWVKNTVVEIGKDGDSEEENADAPVAIMGSLYGGGENGHNLQGAKITLYGGTIGNFASVGASFDNGNIYGAGCGTDTYTIGDDPTEHHNPMAGIVRGNTNVTIIGGKVLRNVYGGGSMGSLDGVASVTVNGGIIGTNGLIHGNVYGGPKGSIDDTEVIAHVLESQVNVNYPADIRGSVFGGGEAGIVKENVVVNINGGTVSHDVYGGGALANTNVSNTLLTPPSPLAKTTVNLHGGSITHNVYGGGLGRLAKGTEGQEGYVQAIQAKVYGDVLVELNGKKVMISETETWPDSCVVKSEIFGCNNLNGSPQRAVTVHVFKTNGYPGHVGTAREKLDSETASDHSYHLKAVYGGGNLAAFIPDVKAVADTVQARVIIDGCDQTSIETVYGGGNAASTPATHVTINGTYEISELFGGGNGKDDIYPNDIRTQNPGANVGFKDYSAVEDDERWNTKEKRETNEEFISTYVYGSGKAAVDIFGGRVHRVFGGSNTKGNVRKTAVTMLDESSGCDFCVDEAYGGGKSASMDAEAQLLLACIPGLKAVYGGAEAADIHDNVTLNITNGKFDRIFGGNNKSGMIRGAIKLNIEETGCKPIVIGELYGGGNMAAYSVYGYDEDGKAIEEGDIQLFANPEVNVKSFTSIGSIYGGGYGSSAVMVANPTVNINEVVGSPTTYPTTGDYDATGYKGKTITIDGHTVTLPAHVRGKIGAIGQVFGGGNAAKVIGSTNVNVGNLATIDYVTKVSGEENPRTNMPVVGANIVGNVFGGGNAAEVTGNTNVMIGR